MAVMQWCIFDDFAVNQVPMEIGTREAMKRKQAERHSGSIPNSIPDLKANTGSGGRANNSCRLPEWCSPWSGIPFAFDRIPHPMLRMRSASSRADAGLRRVRSLFQKLNSPTNRGLISFVQVSSVGSWPTFGHHVFGSVGS